jgi:hypothetical protein
VPTLKTCLDQYSSRYEAQLEGLQKATDKMNMEFQATVDRRSQEVDDSESETEVRGRFNDADKGFCENSQSSVLHEESSRATDCGINDFLDCATQLTHVRVLCIGRWLPANEYL